MNLVRTGIEGLVVLEPRVFGDARGYFFESYNERAFHGLGLRNKFVQDNESFSTYGILRGLHLQAGEAAQAKLVRVVQGRVLDVAVDVRPGSETFGKHFSVELSAENKKMMLVPRGFAHGFVVLSETAVFQYKCDNFYDQKAELGIIFDDPDLAIDWRIPRQDVRLSDKDKLNKRLTDLRL